MILTMQRASIQNVDSRLRELLNLQVLQYVLRHVQALVNMPSKAVKTLSYDGDIRLSPDSRKRGDPGNWCLSVAFFLLKIFGKMEYVRTCYVRTYVRTYVI